MHDDSPYRSLREHAPRDHWHPLSVTIARACGGKLGPFAWGHVWWGDEYYFVIGTTWCAVWFRVKHRRRDYSAPAK